MVAMKLCWPAPERNKQPILEVLLRVLPAQGRLLELASGTGQHIAHFAQALRAWQFVPSDVDPGNLASIEAHREVAPGNVAPAQRIDVREPDWGIGAVDAMFCANMIHIAPWSCCVGLFQGAGRHLASPGVVVLYGPFRVGGAHTSQSNADFDQLLRSQNPEWGVRDVESVAEQARGAGLWLEERAAMPANNQCLIFRRGGGTASAD